MFFRSIRRRGGPVAASMLSVFVLSLVPVRPARADVVGGEDTDVTPASHGVGGPRTMGQPSGAPGSADALITADPVNGAAHASLSFDLPQARGAAQPSLSLSYNSSTGMGLGGMGWSLNLPSIERRGASGYPNFIDVPVGATPGPPVNPATDPDDFVLDGQPLVPICVVASSGTCVSGEAARLPTWLAGWTYYHPEVDTFVRAFRSPDYATWVVQLKSGIWMEFGTPLDDPADGGGLETHDELVDFSGLTPNASVYRWDLVRQLDASRTNRVVYTWSSLGLTDGEQPASQTEGLRYLTDIYDTFPSTTGAGSLPAQAAHHTHLFWRGHDKVLRYSPGWKSTPARVLGDVAVSSVTMTGAAGSARSLVRLYHLEYTSETAYEQRFLRQFQQYGCSATESGGNIADPATWAYAAGACPTLPSTQFDYETPIEDGWPTRTIAKVNTQTIQGFTTGYTSTAMVDVDGDGLSDLLASNGPYPNEPPKTTALVVLGSTPGVEYPVTPDTSSDNGGPRYAFPGEMLPTLRSYWGDWLGTSQQTLLFLNASCGDVGYEQYTPPVPPGGHQLTTEIYEFGGPGTAGSQGALGAAPSWPGSGPSWGGVAQAPFDNAGQPDYTEGYDNSTYWEQGKVFDVDGDGLTDITQIPISRAYPFAGARRTYFSVRPKNGQVANGIFARKIFDEQLANYNTSGYHAVADMDADGLADIVEVEANIGSGPSTFGSNNSLRWWKNRGDGRFGDVGNADYAAYTSMPATSDLGVQPVCANCNWPLSQHGSNIAIGDVNGDSLADVVVLQNKTLSVYTQMPRAAYTLNNEIGPFNLPAITYPNAASNDNAAVSISADGAGMPTIVLQDVNTVTTFQLKSSSGQAGKYGLMTAMWNSAGRQTTVTYDSVVHLSQIASPAWTTKLPVPTMVVTSTMTQSGQAEPDGTFDAYTTSFAYTDPFYDARDHAFVGFRMVTTTTQGTAASPGTKTTTTYVPPVCATQPCNFNVDYGLRILRGLPYAVQVSDATSGQMLSATLTTWNIATTHTGLDGRFSRMAYVGQVDTFPGDIGQGTMASGLGGTTATDLNSRGFAFTPPATQVPIGVLGKLPLDLRQVQQQDSMGDLVTTVDEGALGTDTPIMTQTTWSLSPDDTSGWFYRPTQVQTGYAAYSSRFGFTGAPREVDYTYNAFELVTKVWAPLSGTLPLVRSNPGGQTAPTPTNASVNSASVTLGSYGYDAWNNVSQIQGPDGHCTGIVYDSGFNQLPVTVNAYKSGCGGAALTTTLSYDRGLGAVTSAYDPALAETLSKYDVFGRLIEVDQPSVTTLSTTDATPAETIDWSLYPAQLHVKTPARESYVSFDSFGRPRHRLDSTETAGQWIVSGLTQLYPSGAVQKAYRPFLWSGQTSLYAIAPGTTPYSSFTYDAAGRTLTSTGPDGVATGNFTYHPLSTVVMDGDQVKGASRAGSFSTTQSDGHGRTVSSVQTLANGPVDQITTAMTYLATGEVSTVTRSHTADAKTYSRSLQYDSLGRLVSNVEPNTSFSRNTLFGIANGVPATTGSWTYAYDDAGDLVGTSDARGCGENLAYDALGRLTSEDYSPCTNTQAAYSSPTANSGYEAVYVYDIAEDTGAAEPGRLTAAYDRAQHVQLSYDDRGRTTALRKQLAKPGLSSTVIGKASPLGYAPHWFEQDVTTYDEANRVVTRTTGADPAVFGLSASTYLTSHYTPRGTVSSVDGSYGTLLTSQSFNPDGSLLQQILGDVAKTTTDFTYYTTGRVKTVNVHRPTGPWAQATGYSAPSANLEDNLEQLSVWYDAVGNPTQLSDGSTASWPAGSKPQAARIFQYGDDYRLTSATTEYPGATETDPFVSPPYAPEVAAGSHEFPQLAMPGGRVTQQSFTYDFMGNMKSSTDDANDFVDRSLGTITNGGPPFNSASTPPGPNWLTSATLGGSSLSASYDVAGEVTEIDITRAAPCPGSCETTYDYTWDEVGRMATASRSEDDASGNLYTPVSETFAYDASGQRVLEAHTSLATATASPALTYTASIFDSLRLEATTYPDASGDYARSETTEAVLLVANGVSYGRVVYSQTDPAIGASGTQHVFLEIRDHLGSTSFVIDKATSELVEHPTYQAYGAAESDFRSARWAEFREAFRHSGHEDAAEVGLTYFGQRYYSTILSRWMSADPLSIHALGSDLNPYAYVGGSPMRLVDPVGLTGAECDGNCDNGTTTTTTTVGGPANGGGNVGGGGGNGGQLGNTQQPTGAFYWCNQSGCRYADSPRQHVTPPPAAAAQGALQSWIGAAGHAIASGARSTLAAWNTVRTSVANALFDKQAYDASVRANLPAVRVDPLTEGIVQDTPEVAGGLWLMAAGGVGTGAAADGVAMADTAAVQATRYGPMNAGPLPEAVAKTFRSGSYTGTTLTQATTLYRAYGGTAKLIGGFWTRIAPSGPLQATIDLALKQAWGNTASQVAQISVPAGTTIFEGAAAAEGGLVGGGSQVFIPSVDPGWVLQ